MKILPFLLIYLLFSCVRAQQEEKITESDPVSNEEDSIFVILPEFIANQFDYPVGKPDSKGYFNAQKFGKNNHLGDDWNGLGGGNSDLGDPIYAIASGYVTFAKDHNPSWGNVIRIVHFLPDGKQVESLYAHCNEILVSENQWVSVGDKIGTIGNAHGRYKAHLHLELRSEVGLSIGKGYDSNTEGYLDPTEFIDSHRTIISETN
jgi:murein DD-endopeptidase MepM/ murein hydrolase activator NlpD